MPIVCGIHPVLEALNAGSRTIERVVVTKGVRNKRILEVIRRASERGVPLRFEPREALDRAADGERHQGVLAIVAEKGLLTLEDLQKSARTPALFMLLDGVEDPRNLGAIIRSVDAAGADGVILPDRHTASLSDAASRTAAGALESVKIARIGNVVQALETLKAKGFWIVGFDGSGKERWDAIDYKRPIVLVLGGEGKGIRRLVKEHCDHVVSLPVFGQVSSLNVSVAAGIALYEAVRQRGTVPTMARPIPPRALAAKKPVVIGPPPEDREEDPGARRRAAAIASLSAPEPAREAKPETPAPEAIPAPLSLSMPGGALPLPPEADPSSPEPLVKEASLETVTGEHVPGTGAAVASGPAADGGADDEDDEDDVDPGSAAFARETADEGPEDDDREEDDENGDGGEEEEDDGDDADGDEGGDADYDEDDDEDEDEDDDEGEDDEDEEDGGGDEDDQGEEDDEDDEDEYDEDDDPGDESSELAAPFMPDDNSGGGEVTWGSEKELHAHRPRREGERRFGNGGRRSGRPNDRKKKRRPQGGGAPQPGGNGEKTQGAPRDQNRDQQRRRREQNRGLRPPQNGPGADPQNGRSGERPADGNQSEGGASTDAAAPANGQGQPASDQNRDQNRPSGARRRNRRRRGGRGRSGGGDRRPADPNAPPGQPGEGRPPREDRGRNPESQGPRGPRSESQGEGGAGEPRPGGEGAPREGGGGSEQGRRDRDRRRRRRRGRRGPGGSGGGPNRGGNQGGGSDGGSREGGSSGGGGGDQGGSSGGGGGSNSGSRGGNGGGSGGSDPS